jgi:hypothetical protein
LFGYDPTDPYGLSYQKQTVPGVQASPMVDYTAGLTPAQDLDSLLGRLMNNRALFEDFT